MRRCFQLALSGAGAVAPNPMVGAVLVYKDVIIGEGWHIKYGKPHAEVNCIQSVADKDKPLIKESVLYVSLEPCAHYGKTPPCSKLIIEKKIPRVVIGCGDVYKEVDGKGIKQLLAAGISVTAGILEQEAVQLNQRFFTFHQFRRPYIILKWAQTNDHKIAKPVTASGTRRLLISNGYTNGLVHKWRSQEAAIMVGTNTALHDNPSLTNRLWYGKNPVRIVIDNALKLPPSLHLFDGSADTIVFNYLKQEVCGMVKYFRIDKNKNSISQVVEILYQQNIQSILVEGGAALLQSFIDNNCWDEARVVTNTQMLAGDGLAAPVLPHSKLINEQAIQSDHICFYKNMAY